MAPNVETMGTLQSETNTLADKTTTLPLVAEESLVEIINLLWID